VNGLPPRPGSTYHAPMPPPTVPVVEDDPVILRLLEVNFEIEGRSVLLAHAGAEGIEAARAGQRPALPIEGLL